MKSTWTRAMSAMVSILFAGVTALFLFQNCSPQRNFSVGADTTVGKLDRGPACDSSQTYGVCETSEGTGRYVCTNGGLVCVIDKCKNPYAQLINGVCVSNYTLAINIDGKTDNTLALNSNVNVAISSSANIAVAGLDPAKTSITRLSGVCAMNSIPVSTLGINGQTAFAIGSQSFNYNTALADKIGGCKWNVSVTSFEGNKNALATFVAPLCVPRTQAATNKDCMTMEGKRGVRTCQADGMAYECVAVQPLSCNFNGQIIPDGSSVATAYLQPSVKYNETCSSIARKCSDGVLQGDEAYKYASCVKEAPLNCSLGNVQINHGNSTRFYSATSVPSAQVCAFQDRKCTNGSLDGDPLFKYTTCSQDTDCVANGVTVSNGQSRLFYKTILVPFGGTCESLSRTCTQGVLGGSDLYTQTSCGVTPGASCNFGNTVIPHGQQAQGFKNPQVAFGQQCEQGNVTCFNGQIQGAFTNPTCFVQSAANCTFKGQNVNHNASVTAYSTATVPFGSSCSSESRTCSNGLLSGSFDNLTCQSQSASSCTTNNGQVVAHGGSIGLYSSSVVSYGSSCSVRTAVCSNGSFSGGNGYTSCQVSGPVSCTGPDGRTVGHGSSAIYYSQSYLPYGSDCNSYAVTRTCNNGSLSNGSGVYSSCSVAPPPPTTTTTMPPAAPSVTVISRTCGCANPSGRLAENITVTWPAGASCSVEDDYGIASVGSNSASFYIPRCNPQGYRVTVRCTGGSASVSSASVGSPGPAIQCF